MAITLEQARELVGQVVRYQPRGDPGAEPELGVVRSVSGSYVFVQYVGDLTAKATYPDDLYAIGGAP